MSHVGSIKSFNPQKGWGFIECAQTQALYGKDMFVLKNALPGGTANKGDQVSFEVVQEHNGPVATEVQLLQRAAVAPGLIPAAAQPAPAASGPQGGGAIQAASTGWGGASLPSGPGYVGVVKSFSMENGWGMISNPEMEATYGKDVFFSRAAVGGGMAPSTGEQVFFTVKMEPKGPAAASVQVLASSRQGPGRMAAGPRWQANGGGMAGGMGVPSRAWNSNQTFFGVCKSFNEEKGWGHISCEATNRMYGKDVFLMKGALNGQPVQHGALVSFKVGLGQKGPQASSVTLLPPGSFRVDGEEASVFAGSIKSFNTDKGWGFVTSEDIQALFGKDIFIHKRELEGRSPSPGEEVQISVEIDEGGQPVGKVPGSQGFAPVRQRIAPQMAAAGWRPGPY